MATRKIGTHLNFVHNDEIWKDHVRHELQSLRKWPEDWGLMTREYTRLNRRLIGERVTPEAGDSVYPTRCPSAVDRDQLGSSSSSQRSGVSSTRLPSILACSRGSTSPTPCQMEETITQSPKLPSIGRPSSGAPATGEHGPGLVAMKPFIPRTTAGEIGRQASRVGSINKLEIYGRYAPNARGQHGILKLLNWPQQGIM